MKKGFSMLAPQNCGIPSLGTLSIEDQCGTVARATGKGDLDLTSCSAVKLTGWSWASYSSISKLLHRLVVGIKWEGAGGFRCASLFGGSTGQKCHRKETYWTRSELFDSPKLWTSSSCGIFSDDVLSAALFTVLHNNESACFRDKSKYPSLKFTTPLSDAELGGGHFDDIQSGKH